MGFSLEEFAAGIAHEIQNLMNFAKLGQFQ